MTKKDYELIAGAARSLMATGLNKRLADREGGEKALRLVAIDLAATLAKDNPRFDRCRFLAACGVN